MELGTHNVGEACGANTTKGCKANSYTWATLHKPYILSHVICIMFHLQTATSQQ